LLAEIIKEMGFSKAADFYVSLGMGKSSTETVVNKVMQRLKAGQEVEDSAAEPKAQRPRSATASSSLGIEVDGLADVLVRMARCCNAVPGDEIVGYISLGRGITVHRGDCPNVGALRKNPERFTEVTWSGSSQQAFRVDIAVDAWDRPRLLEDVSRAFSEHGGNIITASCRVDGEMVHDRFLVEVGDPETLREIVGALRQIESVFDAYRLSPGGG
jgi:GTP pyrophosphokinase